MSQIGLKNLGIDPDGGKIGNRVQLRFRLDIGIRQSIAFCDVAGSRRVDREVGDHLSGGVQFFDFALRYLPLLKTLFGSGYECVGSVRDTLNRALPELLLILARQKIFLFGGDKVWTVNRE